MKYEVFNIFHFGGCRSKFVILICIFVQMGIQTCWTKGQPFHHFSFWFFYVKTGWNSMTWVDGFISSLIRAN
jgi:hypothetical protein